MSVALARIGPMPAEPPVRPPMTAEDIEHVEEQLGQLLGQVGELRADVRNISRDVAKIIADREADEPALRTAKAVRWIALAVGSSTLGLAVAALLGWAAGLFKHDAGHP